MQDWKRKDEAFLWDPVLGQLRRFKGRKRASHRDLKNGAGQYQAKAKERDTVGGRKKKSSHDDGHLVMKTDKMYWVCSTEFGDGSRAHHTANLYVSPEAERP